MGLIYTAVGALALTVGGGLVWGIFIVLELLTRSLSLNVLQYVVPAPVVIFFCYLLGNAILENRKESRR